MKQVQYERINVEAVRKLSKINSTYNGTLSGLQKLA